MTMLAATLSHRFTVEEYYQMAEVGILKPDAEVELIDGVIVDRMPMGPFHSGAVGHLLELLTQVADGRWMLSCQGPLHIDSHNEPQPDLMLLRPAAHRYKTDHPTPEDVYLVIEVSDSSLSFDQRTKLPLYARAGVPEVWILNVPLKQLEIHRQPTFTGYEQREVLRAGMAAPAAFPDATLDVAALMR